jgi:hypothetical protein
MWALLAVVIAHRSAAASSCHEISDVVGLEHCSRFGMWSRDGDVPAMWFDFGYFHRNFALDPTHLEGAARTMGPTLAPIDEASTSNGLYWRGIGALGRAAYVGGDFQWGALGKMPPVAPYADSYGLYMGLHAIAGVHAERFRIALAGELAAGFRAAELVYCASRTNCKGSDQASDGQSAWELEARVRADVFFWPSFTLGVSYGHSVIAHDDSTLLLTLGVHMRVIDGMY